MIETDFNSFLNDLLLYQTALTPVYGHTTIRSSRRWRRQMAFISSGSYTGKDHRWPVNQLTSVERNVEVFVHAPRDAQQRQRCPAEVEEIILREEKFWDELVDFLTLAYQD